MESLPYGVSPCLLARIMITLDEMPYEELILALCLEHESQAEGVEEPPGERVHQVEGEQGTVRAKAWGEEGEDDGVPEEEYKLEIRCTGGGMEMA
jgi:hypothetical protein